MGWLGKNVRGVVALAGAAVLLAGCVTQGAFATAEKLDRRAADLNVVLMPPDIVLFELTVGGVQEPNALWTASAKSHAGDALKALLEQRNTQLVAYKEPDVAEGNHLHDQVIKLHATVGNAILVHQDFQPLVLPSKKDKFEWTLGDGLRAVGRDEGADYALFVHIRDSYSSPGRVAVQVMGALIGIGIPGGAQVGYASLVDLRTGEVVWFNRLARASGDLRKPEAARETIEALMSKFPT